MSERENPMHVLLTGAAGMVGSHVLEYLLEKTNWTFVCPCSWRHKGNPLNIEPNDRVRVITCDLVGPIPELGFFDYILHLASDSHVDRSIKDPVGFIENNVSSTLSVLEYARAHHPEVFIQFSTDEVYGAREHQEWDVLLPANPYAASKAAQEMCALAYWRTFGVPVVITNSNNVVGRNQHPEKYVPKLVQLINAGMKVQIHVFEGQCGRRYYNPVENIADALLFILNLPPEAREGPCRFNLPGGEELDNLEMAQLIADLLGRPLYHEMVDVSLIRPGYDEFYPKTDGQLLKLGWKPPLSLAEGLRWVKEL